MVAVQVLFIKLEIPMTIYYGTVFRRSLRASVVPPAESPALNSGLRTTDDVGLCATADSKLTDATISTLNAELAATLPGLLDGLRLINSTYADHGPAAHRLIWHVLIDCRRRRSLAAGSITAERIEGARELVNDLRLPSLRCP